MTKTALTRRDFLRSAGPAAAAIAAGPYLIASSASGAEALPAPGSRITMGCIGVGRMGSGNMHGFLAHSDVQIVAVCDVDARRRQAAKKAVEGRYAARAASRAYKGCTAYGDFRDLVARDDIDAVVICTPDHWHVLPAIAAARAGKDIYLEKPLSLTIAEGRALSDTVRRCGGVFQTGSQQRSDAKFRFACELVRNGLIGRLHTVTTMFGGDPATTIHPATMVPEGLDYEFWLGPAPWAPYTQERVHPQNDYGRPGWLRISDYSGGMMTGWGSHHNDIAQWGTGMELSGPVEIEGRGQFPRDGLWDVHGEFRVEYTYANGVKLICQSKGDGVRFEGSDGWVFVDRGKIDAQPRSLLRSAIGPGEIHLQESGNHHRNFLDCVKTRRDPIAPVEVGHRSATVCHLGNIAMKLGRKLKWDPDRERFVDDDGADRETSRPMRAPWHL